MSAMWLVDWFLVGRWKTCSQNCYMARRRVLVHAYLELSVRGICPYVVLSMMWKRLYYLSLGHGSGAEYPLLAWGSGGARYLVPMANIILVYINLF